VTLVVKFPDAVWGRLASVAEAKKMKIADVIVEAAQALLEGRKVEVPVQSGPKVAATPEPAPEPMKPRDVLAVLDMVQQLHELNRSQAEIAKATGFNPDAVATILLRLGLVPVKQPKPHALDLVAFKRLYDLGWSDREISTELHVSGVTVGRERRALGLPAVGKPGRKTEAAA
jgi:hypothetical protein